LCTQTIPSVLPHSQQVNQKQRDRGQAGTQALQLMAVSTYMRSLVPHYPEFLPLTSWAGGLKHILDFQWRIPKSHSVISRVINNNMK
jgi:hypothetical protein